MKTSALLMSVKMLKQTVKTTVKSEMSPNRSPIGLTKYKTRIAVIGSNDAMMVVICDVYICTASLLYETMPDSGSTGFFTRCQST